jgi:predicted GH43/DUF377 family glycosyl hydrolase
VLKTTEKFATRSTQAIVKQIEGFGISNVFNPSVCAVEDGFWVAFRGFGHDHAKPFQAFLARLGKDGTALNPPVNLNHWLEALIQAPVCDPKVFKLGDRTWMTFNTGHFETPNRIFILDLECGNFAPLEVKFEGRSLIEKNWSFILSGEKLFAVYSIDPLIILEEWERSDTAITFGPSRELANVDGQGRVIQTRKPKFTIGTPFTPIPATSNTFACIIHRRFYLRKKRCYFGKPGLLTFSDGTARFERRSDLWCHSYRDLLGTTQKHNPSLLSCTYFSGLSAFDDRVYASYGVNDVDYSIVEMPPEAWD